jgi:hypothetical protein
VSQNLHSLPRTSHIGKLQHNCSPFTLPVVSSMELERLCTGMKRNASDDDDRGNAPTFDSESFCEHLRAHQRGNHPLRATRTLCLIHVAVYSCIAHAICSVLLSTPCCLPTSAPMAWLRSQDKTRQCCCNTGMQPARNLGSSNGSAAVLHQSACCTLLPTCEGSADVHRYRRAEIGKLQLRVHVHTMHLLSRLPVQPCGFSRPWQPHQKP